MKKFLAILLALVMVLSLAACGGSTSGEKSTEAAKTEEKNDTPAAESTGTTLRLINGKIEVDAQLKKLAEMYEAETGVKVEIESLGGGIDIQGTIKGYYQADNMPDIFVNGGAADFDNWEGLLVDMSGEAWAADTDSAYVDETYGTIGFPYTVEAVGLAYNADLIAKAGIDPATLNTPAALADAFAKLDSMKDELGITAVIGYSAEPTNLYWSTGNHMFANYLDAGLARDDRTYIDLLSDGGQLDADRLTKFAELFAVIHQYSDPALLVSGTYDQQVQGFAAGKYVFVTQGNWIGATMTTTFAAEYEAAGSFQCGMVPYAFDETANTILTNSPSWWAVYDGPNAEAAKAFLQWCSEAEAQEVLVAEAGFISPFKSCTTVASDPFAANVSAWNASGASAWHWLEMTDGLAQNYTGQIFADFAAGNLDVAGFVAAMQQVCATAYAG
ncbi:MAG: extracellular solute-binding protein [Oscillospiraceae bacterium]|nr:extracellular solute-binding protein [Oscillospiraceae bacterium]